MATNKETSQNIKLGIFALSGLVVLVFCMYIMGKNQNLFGSNMTLKARFKTVSGLTEGNNVRFSGLEAGTVKAIEILNDTMIQVEFVVKRKLQEFIPKNSLAEIGNEGLMGNKVVNITPPLVAGPHIEDGDMLPSKNELNTGSMIETFSRTNDNVEVISNDLRITLEKLNQSKAIWSLLDDSSLTHEVKTTLVNFRKSSESLNSTAADIHDLVKNLKNGDGVAGMLLTDKKEADNLRATLDKLKQVSDNTERLTARLDSMARVLQTDMKDNHGPVQTLLRDHQTADRINNSVNNLEQASLTFKQEMDALKQNKLMKKYLKRQARQQKADSAAASGK